MRRLNLCILLALMCTLAAPCQQGQDSYILSGVITRIASPTDFDVNGTHVLLTPATHFRLGRQDRKQRVYLVSQDPSSLGLYLGSTVQITSAAAPRNAVITATDVSLDPPNPPRSITGTAIVEAISPPATNASPTLRADGYTILITPKTALKFTAPLAAISDIHANLWVAYTGTTQPDGSLLATRLAFSPNQPTPAFLALKQFWDYDPSSVPQDIHQSGGSKILRGIDPSQYPLHHDSALESRLNTIGQKLIPAWQAALPPSDPTRIDFRFYLIDRPNWRDAAPLPSGIILVPYQIVNRLSDDSQLAAVLADKIAGLMEQQTQPLPLTNDQVATGWALTGAQFIPVVGIAAAGYNLKSGVSSIKQMNHDRQQRERVSLSLLHNAGYDLTQAPAAWWLLAPKQEKDLNEIRPPTHTLELYRLLAENWHPTPSGYTMSGSP